jgi:predicted acyl esterase
MYTNWRDVISQPEYGILTEKDVMVPVRDGVKLGLDIYRPDAEGKFPALLAMSGYGKDLQDELISPQPLNKSAIWDGNIEAGDTSEIVPRGYVHVIGDCRGTGISEGEYPGMWSSQEGRDGADIVEWIAQQPWCDGNVGMIGYSYYGGIQLKVAIEQPPHLKSIFVSHIASDFYRDWVYVGGVLSLFFYGLWHGRHGTSGYAPKHALSLVQESLSPKEFKKLQEELLDDPDIRNYPNLYHLVKYPYKNPPFFDYLANPFDGPLWQDKSMYPFFDKIKVPTFVVGKAASGFGSYWDVYEGLTCFKQLWVKPGKAEERPWREDLEFILRWHDYWLKGIDTGVEEDPQVKLYVTGANEYRYFDEWPIDEAEKDYTKVYLRRWESLSFQPELYQPDPDCYLQMPLHLSTKRDSVKYVSPALPESMEVMGHAAINFYASIDTDDAYWIVRLQDLAPDGRELSLSKGYLKATHRAVDPAKTKPQRPYHPHVKKDPVEPGQVYEYNIEFGNINHVFKPGHRIKLVIESMESPRDPEMQIHYHPHLNSSRTTLHKIFRNREFQSHLVLPITAGKDAVTEVMSDENFQGGV